jgi:hypothetical protein
VKYTIYSINEKRKQYKTVMRTRLGSWDEVDVHCVDGGNETELQLAMDQHPYEIKFDAKVGQLGIWYSFLNALEHAPILTFDDDALLNQMFSIQFSLRLKELPEDADFFQLFLPRDSDHMYDPSADVGRWLTRCYSRYGGVGFYFTEKGAANIKNLVRQDGIFDQYDNTLLSYAKSGDLNGYCSKPQHPDLVYITGLEQSIVQESERYEPVTEDFGVNSYPSAS